VAPFSRAFRYNPLSGAGRVVHEQGIVGMSLHIGTKHFEEDDLTLVNEIADFLARYQRIIG